MHADAPVVVQSWLGLTFLLFLAGLEIDPAQLRGPLVRAAGLGYLLNLAVATPVAPALAAAGWIGDPALLVIILSATALGLVVPVIRDSGGSSGAFGRTVGVAATVADVAAGPAARWTRLRQVLASLQDSTAQIRVRLAVILLVALAALAARTGLETILGAFVAGVVISVLDRRPREHPGFRPKLDAVGFGLLIPVFYVTTGIQLDVRSLLEDTPALLRVPVLLLALLVVRGVPAALFVRALGERRAVAAGFLQATSLPFIVASTRAGVGLGVMSPTTAAALVSTGILSVAVPPAVASNPGATATRPAGSGGTGRCRHRARPGPGPARAGREHDGRP